MADIQSIEDWCIAIAMHTRLTHEALEKGTGGLAGASLSAANAQSRSLKMFDATVGRLERALSNQTASLAARAQGLASRGMQGTVENAQQDYAMEQLSKQLAAVFKPVTQALTYGASKLAQTFQRMDGAQQNRMLGLFGGATLGGMMGGARGALAGAVLGPMGMDAITGNGGAGGWAGGMAGGAAGALLGYTQGGLPGAAVGAGAGGFLGAGGPGVYSELRSRGYSKVGAGARSAMAAIYDLGPGGFLADATEMATGTRLPITGRGMVGLSAPRPRSPDPRRDVTPFSAEMGEAGGLHFKLQTDVVRATAGPHWEDGGPLKPFMDVLLDILRALMGIATSSGVTLPEPRSTRPPGS